MQKDPPLWRQEEGQQQACVGTACESMTCGKMTQKIEEDHRALSVVMPTHDWRWELPLTAGSDELMANVNTRANNKNTKK